jgi:hypothetical protein
MMPSGWTRKRGSTWTWYIEDVPDPRTGRPRQVSKGGFRTRKEARDALLEAQAALRSGTLVEPSKRTVSSYLLEEWLPENQPPRLRPSSFANYTIYTRTHVVPRLGDIELQRLTPSNLSAFYRALLTDARRDGQGLAPKTVRNIHAMLHRALKDAVRLGYLVRNVADAVTPPRGVSPEMQVWTPEQLRAFLAHARHDHLYALWLLVVTTGMRRAELAGLRWVDVGLGRVVDHRSGLGDGVGLDPLHPRTAAEHGLDHRLLRAAEHRSDVQDGRAALLGCHQDAPLAPKRRSRSELATTLTLDNAMAAPATTGLSSPAAASGMAAVL